VNLKAFVAREWSLDNSKKQGQLDSVLKVRGGCQDGRGDNESEE